jgi:hypothetical protein
LRELIRASQAETMPIDRSRIRKGMLLVSDPPLPGYTPKREPLPAEFEHFEQASPKQPIVFRPSITIIGPR